MKKANKCKVLALYLPQFHRIPENDNWWGEGFTEWSVVRKATKLSKHTVQPRIPVDGYYDLSDVNSIRRQADLANQHGVDGFVIYSYYSKGKLLLQTPAELLLAEKDIQISYCFSWANHDWMRTWFSYNKEMLRKQEYDDSEDGIRQQFEYYQPFFFDDRYIKVDNKPVLFIYDVEAIPNFEQYREVWNRLAIACGFGGIYFVQTLGGHRLVWNRKACDACFDFEPTYTTFSQMKVKHTINRALRFVKKKLNQKWIANYFCYDKVCDLIETRNECDSNHILGLFAEWDNTPRHAHNGTVFTGFTIERFKKCFRIQLKKSIEYGKPFIVIDAWNEWGEGAFLEPDQVYGNKKLCAIKEVVESLDGAAD